MLCFMLCFIVSDKCIISIHRIKTTHVASSTFNTQVKPIQRKGQAKGYSYSLFQDSITTVTV